MTPAPGAAPSASTSCAAAARATSGRSAWPNTIFRYNGSAWTTQAGGPGGQLIGLYVAPDGTAFVSSAPGALYRFSAGAAINVPTSSGAIFAMSSLSATSVLLGGDVNVVGTYDGRTYRALPAYPSARSYTVRSSAPIAMLWLVGVDGSVLHTMTGRH